MLSAMIHDLISLYTRTAAHDFKTYQIFNCQLPLFLRLYVIRSNISMLCF